jgi:SAM-dependent methyltransferase
MPWFKDWFNSPYYHILYGKRDVTEAETLIRLLIKYLNPAQGATFLDLACGKGRHSRHISAMGYNTYGIDLSVHSIEEAKQYESEQLHFDVHDMRTVYKHDFFDYVLNLFTSFGYFDDSEDNAKTIQAVSESMKEQAVFVQDYFNAKKIKSNFKFSEKKEVNGILFDINKHIEGNDIIKTIHFIDNGIEHRFREQVALFELNDFQKMYQAAGLKIVACFGDYQLNPFDDELSERLIIISKKQ